MSNIEGTGFMTYPPQQPGAYGQQPGQFGPAPYPRQPGPPGYPGGPGYPYPGGGPPKRRRTGMIVTIAIVAVLGVGGAVAAIIALTSGDDKQSSASGDTGSDGQGPAAAGEKPAAADEPADDPDEDEDSGLHNPRAAAKAYIDAISARDKTAATYLTCDKAGPGQLYELVSNADWKVELANVTLISDESANAEVKTTSTSGSQTTVPGLLLENWDGVSWCVSL